MVPVLQMYISAHLTVEDSLFFDLRERLLIFRATLLANLGLLDRLLSQTVDEF